MASSRFSRPSARHLLVVAVLLIALLTTGASAAKCTAKTSVAPTTASPDLEVTIDDTTDVTTETPEATTAVTDASEVTTDAPEAEAEASTDVTTDAPEAEASTDAPEATTATPTAEIEETSAPTATESSTATSSSTGTSTSTSSSVSSEAATFGDVTSADGECVVGNPNTYISTAYVDWVWENRMKTDVVAYKNWIFDQLVANNGSLTYCVRWDSNSTLAKTTASKFQDVLNRQFKAWNHWLVGYDCWPFEEVDVTIVGYAVREASMLDWSDDSLGTIYEGVLDTDGIPQCPDECYKHLGALASGVDTSSCAGEGFDMSMWLTEGLGGGYGYDWGQQVDWDNFLAQIDDEQLQILAHEIGHGFGLPDFYETTDKPADDFPACIMEAGASMTITDGDGWMLRRALENIKDRYSF
ncbi:hypothetical protein BBJ28_00025041 [Nothophytophthora sp. Chile5]|nr:hypothetical protein BBJ28_00025041 [Nothophytophthora sp. Chile5]